MIGIRIDPNDAIVMRIQKTRSGLPLGVRLLRIVPAALEPPAGTNWAGWGVGLVELPFRAVGVRVVEEVEFIGA